MKLKSLIILLVITAVLAGLSILVLRPQKNEKSKIGALLLPDLPVNEVAQITLTAPESSVVLVKGSDVWQVENRFGYPADFGQISEFVRKFSKLKVGRSFEGTPESLARLKLLDPTRSEAITQERASNEGASNEGASGEGGSKEEEASDEGASEEIGPQNSGTRVQLADADGKKIAAYILGSTRSSDSGSGGQYLRPAENDTVYLVDQSFRFLKKKPAEWLQHDVLNIKEAEVRQVDCYTAEAEEPRFTVSRSEKGKPATLHEVPKGRKADPVKIEQLFGALAPLKIKDIAGKRQVPAPTSGDGLHLTYALFNGQQIDIYPRKAARKAGEGDDAQYELQAFVTYQAPPADEAASADADAPAEADAPASAVGEKSADPTAVGTPDEDTANTTKEKAEEDKAPTEEEVRALTEDLSAKLSGWTFVIEEWQWKSLITEVKGLLEEVKKKGEK